ncbi:hypothetical protein CFOL_v3_13592, partial [Cephalotus follicularis]
IHKLLNKNLIRPSKSPWNCTTFYVKNSEIERKSLRLVINYKPLNTALQWIRYPIPNKKDLLERLTEAKVFSKFDSGLWDTKLFLLLFLKITNGILRNKNTQSIKQIKIYAKEIHYLCLASSLAFKIVETNTSDIG